MTRPMTSAPPAALLRLRQGDIVRLCGFTAATRGLELADRHAVTVGRRDGPRLAARVAGEDPADPPCEVRVALSDSPDAEGLALTWQCSAHPSALGDLGCEHVAALLTAWVRAPADFPSADPSPPTRPPQPTETSPPHPHPASQLTQPYLMGSAHAVRSRGERLLDELERLPSNELLAMARRAVGEDLALHEARDALLTALADPEQLANLLERLDNGPRMLYAAVHLLGGAITAGDLDAIAIRSDQSPTKLRAEMAVLARHGLVFPVAGHGLTAKHDDLSQDKPQESTRDLTGWRIPLDVRTAFSPRLPMESLPASAPNGLPILPTGSPTSPAKRRIALSSPRPLIHSLALLSRAPAPLGPFGLLRPDDAQPPGGRAATAFALPGDLPAGRIAALARAAGLDPAATILARHLLLLAQNSAPAQPLTDLSCVPPSEHLLALRAGFAVWREAEVPFELPDLEASGSPLRVRVDASSPAYDPSLIGREVAAARHFVLRLLAALQPGTWYPVEQVLDVIWWLDPLFLRRRQQTYRTPAWWLERTDGNERRPLRASVREEWEAGEAEYLRRLFATALHAWGMLDLAYERSGQLQALRVTPLGAFLLTPAMGAPVPAATQTSLAADCGAPALPTRTGEIAVQPLGAGPMLLEALERWTRVAGVAGGRLLYALDADLAARALDQGASVEELPARLRTVDAQTGGRVADLVARRLSEWQAAYGATRIAEGWALLEARDEATLLEALALVSDLTARCRWLDARQALVPPDDLAALQAALARRGFAI